MVRNPEENMNLLKHLAHEFQNDGWNWYIKTFEKKNVFPYQWAGERPDLIMKKNEDIIAVCVETPDSLLHEGVFDKWRAFQKKNVRLMIAVRDRETYEIAKELASTNNIDCDFRIVKRQYKRNYNVKKLNLFKKDAKTIWLAIAIGLFVLTGTVLLVAPKIFNALVLKNDFYMPHDSERQNDYMKKLLNNMNK